ncbi:hypothetical protein C8R43DRAFT_942197 [Mycena crocata]|nr:hypothetical protein C8R43DRAFT_942197 [Mycena crocata]
MPPSNEEEVAPYQNAMSRLRRHIHRRDYLLRWCSSHVQGVAEARRHAAYLAHLARKIEEDYVILSILHSEFVNTFLGIDGSFRLNNSLLINDYEAEFNSRAADDQAGVGYCSRLPRGPHHQAPPPPDGDRSLRMRPISPKKSVVLPFPRALGSHEGGTISQNLTSPSLVSKSGQRFIIPAAFSRPFASLAFTTSILSVMVNIEPPHEYPLYDIDELEPPSPPSCPLYDIDEILASLTLEDDGKDPRPDSSPTPPPKSPEPPATPERRSTRSAPCTPARQRADPHSSSTIYVFQSPQKSGFTSDWSEAANATQGTSRSHVRAVYKTAKSRTGKILAYVVFRGRTIGVFESWDPVRVSTTGVRFALHQGYMSVEAAHHAFSLAQENGWTRTASATLLSSPINITNAPLPISEGAPLIVSQLFARGTTDAWYVVYAGVNPGVFGSYIECALNVLGIRNSSHESIVGYDLARLKFSDAAGRGEVHVRRFTMVAELKSVTQPEIVVSPHAAAQAKYRAKNAEAEREKARLRMRKLRQVRKEGPQTSAAAPIDQARQDVIPQDYHDSSEFKEFCVYMDTLVPVFIDVDDEVPGELGQWEKFLATNPCTLDLEPFEDSWVEQMKS